MASALFSAGGPPSNHHRIQLNDKGSRLSRNSWVPMQCSAPFKLIVPLCSPSSTAAVEEDDLSPSPDALPLPSESQDFPWSGCKACGREEIEKGCNGEGRIQGGIATVPGFGWWPIKAYRPCPGFVASGGRYRRQGQSMDEVVSGRAGDNRPSVTTATVTATATNTDEQPSKKKEGPRKFKR